MAVERPGAAPPWLTKSASIAALLAIAALSVGVGLWPWSQRRGHDAGASELRPAVPVADGPLSAANATPGSAVESIAGAIGPLPDRSAAPPTSGGSIVVGFRALDATTGQPLAARGDSLSFVLTRLAERWIGRSISAGPRFDEALAAFDPGSTDGDARLLVVELDPATPRGVPVAFTVELERGAQRGAGSAEWTNLEGDISQLARALDSSRLYRGTVELTLTDAPYQRLGDVPCKLAAPLAAGVVRAAPDVDLQGARVEVMDVRALHAGESNLEQALAPFVACASGQVRPDGTFTVPAPDSPVRARLRLRVVLASGHVYDQSWNCLSYARDVSLHIEGATRTAVGRLFFRGASARGLATVHAAQADRLIGTSELEADGGFTLRGLPYEPFEVVVQSARPAGELARYPLATLTARSDSAQLDLGTLELEGTASILELELVNTSGEPTDAQLSWKAEAAPAARGCARRPYTPC